MTSLKQQSVSGFRWNVIENIAVRGIQFLLSLLLARILEPSDFGVVGLLTIFIVISQTFVDSGFSNALIRKVHKTEVDYSTAFYFNTSVGIMSYVVLFAVSPSVAKFFDIELLSSLLKVLGLSVLINSFFLVPVAKLTTDLDFKSQTIASLVSVVLSGAIGIWIAYAGYGVWALVWQNIFMSFIKGIILIVYTGWLPKLVFSKDAFKYLYSFGSKLLVSNLLFTLYTQLTTILIGKFYSTTDLGFYTRGRQFANLPIDIIMGVLGKVTFPVLSKLQNNDLELIRAYRKLIRLTSCVCVFGLLFLAAIAKPLIIILLTEKWSESVIYLQLFCLGMLLDHITRLNLNLLQVKGRSDLYLRLEIIKRIVSISILLIALPFGLIYLCFSLITYAVFAFFVNTYYTGKLFQLTCWEQLQDMLKYLLCAIFSCIPTYVISLIDVIPNTVVILAGGIMSVSLYWLMLRNDDFMNEIIHIIKESFFRR